LPLKVLIVEDNPTARVTLEKLLAMEGFAVQSAGTLREGQELLEGHAAVILDLDLPDGSGVDLLKKIRTEKLPVKVLIATATQDPALLGDVQRLQPDALLAKPLDVTKILEHLDPPS
jgi:DNA-binding response OmpR family regulator